MIAGTLTFDPEILELSLSLDAPLTKGQYRASVAPVSDISGNLLNETTSWTFEVRVTNIWIQKLEVLLELLTIGLRELYGLLIV